MTIFRNTEGTVCVENWSSKPMFGMDQQQSFQVDWGQTHTRGKLFSPRIMEHRPDDSDSSNDDASPISTSFDLVRPNNNRDSRVFDYPKATLFQRPSDSAGDSGGKAESPRDRNYFSDNFLDIPNPIPTASLASGFNNNVNVISVPKSFRTTSLGSCSENEAFSDDNNIEPLQCDKKDDSKSVPPPRSGLTETDQDIRRLTLASDSINPSHTSEQDFDSLLSNIERLRESGWFYENITRHQAKQLLRSKSMGSFIIRESTDPKHLFSLSVRTQRGTTSARIEYTNGRFRLDCEDSIRHHMPVFSCVVKLVNFYIKMGQKGNKTNPCVWLESTGRRDMPVRLTRPVRKEMPNLRHMCRLTVANSISEAQDSLFPNQEMKMIAKLPLPNPLIQYLQSYPYAH